MTLNSAGEAKILRLVPEDGKECKVVCLCGKQSPHATRTDAITAHPGTPWWDALDSADVGDLVVVKLPKGELYLRVEDIKTEEAPPDSVLAAVAA